MTNPETQRTRPLRVIIAVLGVLLGFALAAANPVTVVQARDAAAFVQPMGHRVVEGVTPPAPPYAVSNRSGTPSVLRTEDVPEPPTHDATGERFRDGMVITGATPHRLILFTFDDGPHWKTTPRLLDMLDATGIHAVFFLTGDRLVGQGKRQDEQRALVKEIAARGHFVGNHTFAHVQLPLLTEPEVVEQIELTEDLIVDQLGARPWLLRLPGGSRSARIDRIVADHGYTSMLWNLGSGDFQVDSPDAVLDTLTRVLERRERENGERGGVILLHDTHEWSVEAFPRIVAELQRRNCALLEQGEELYDIVDDPSLFFIPRADASPSEAAPAAIPRTEVLEARQRRLREETAMRCSVTATL